MTKTKIALIAALVMGTASAAMAEDGFDPNLANRYPAYAAAGASAPQVYRSAPVGLYQGRNVGQDNVGTQGTLDRASNPNAGGV
jgi:hypothetical protein